MQHPEFTHILSSNFLFYLFQAPVTSLRSRMQQLRSRQQTPSNLRSSTPEPMFFSPVKPDPVPTSNKIHESQVKGTVSVETNEKVNQDDIDSR